MKNKDDIGLIYYGLMEIQGFHPEKSQYQKIFMFFTT